MSTGKNIKETEKIVGAEEALESVVGGVREDEYEELYQCSDCGLKIRGFDAAMNHAEQTGHFFVQL